MAAAVRHIRRQRLHQLVRFEPLAGFVQQDDLRQRRPRIAARRSHERVDRAMRERQLAAHLHQLRQPLPLRAERGARVQQPCDGAVRGGTILAAERGLEVGK
ncbi:hypothetical protein FPZ24_06925 [Sphingomonas panacisoli]|uniref:Uncharacterized protein n=1 Tax=Sphingomonas panacisoli TaxID=1813879 RepID=A0A5B8LGN2_9SPHN|nr:hypothetical protein [Sphingomonas panacisoli]QDZ07243.1 hypothetical protein FPZ24_06925 [Sphingomonas panacisoli]